MEEQDGRLAQSFDVCEIDHFEEAHWNFIICNKESAEACQVDNLRDAESVKAFKVIPDDILDGVLKALGVLLDESLTD